MVASGDDSGSVDLWYLSGGSEGPLLEHAQVRTDLVVAGSALFGATEWVADSSADASADSLGGSEGPLLQHAQVGNTGMVCQILLAFMLGWVAKCPLAGCWCDGSVDGQVPAALKPAPSPPPNLILCRRACCTMRL